MNMEITIFIVAIVIGILVNLLTGYLYEPLRSWVRQLQSRLQSSHKENNVIKFAVDDYLKFLSKYERAAWLNFSGKDDGILNQSISEFYFPVKYRSLEDGTENVSSFENLLKFKSRRIAIIGSPGSGKTTLTRFLVAELVKRITHYGILPLYFEARNLINSPMVSPEDWLVENIKSITEISFDSQFLASQLKSGKIWIIIDSIDSVVKVDEREKILKHMVEMALKYPENGILITLRSQLRDEVPIKFENLELIGLSPEDIEEFIRRTTSIIIRNIPTQDVDLKTTFSKHTLELLETLQSNETLKVSASNPLLLSIILDNHFRKSVLPNKSALLYQEYLNAIISRSSDLPSRSTYAILETIALHMASTGKSDVTVNELLKIVDARSSNNQTSKDNEAQLFVSYCRKVGLLNENSESSYSFFHRSFQEYLAARAILYHAEEDQLIQSFPNPEWKNISLMYCGISRDSSDLIENLFEKSSKSPSDTVFFSTCLKEATYINNTLKIKVLRLLVQKLLEEQADSHQHMILLNSCKGIFNPTVSSVVLAWVKDAEPAQKFRGLRTVEALGNVDEDILQKLGDFIKDGDVVENATTVVRISDVAKSVRANLRSAEAIELGDFND